MTLQKHILVSSSYVSQQSCSSTSVSYSSESTSFSSHTVSSSKRTMVTSEYGSTADYSAAQSNFSLLSNGTSSPPALPQKTKIRTPRLPSQYDNVGTTLTNLNQMLNSVNRGNSLLSNDCISPSDGIPPPLPPKMRHSKNYSARKFAQLS
jgi:hypothetical protein